MRKWEKTGTRIYATGEKTITYESGPLKIESRKELIPHAGRSGGWMHTSYFLIWPDGYSREFQTLRDAKVYAEGVPET